MDQYYDNINGYTNLDPTEEYRIKPTDMPNYYNTPKKVHFELL